MNAFKRMMFALLAMLPLAAGLAFAGTAEHGYSRIFIFGDSLSDPGNNFAVTGETSHPPFEPVPVASYGVGGHHYHDGRTWVEFLAQEMGLTEWAKPAYRDPTFGNYAYAHARVRDFSPLGPSFGDQVAAWAAGYCTGIPMNDTLFVVEFAGMDLVDAITAQDPTIVEEAMTSIATNLQLLYGCGARNLLVANIPSIGVTPFVPAENKDFMTAKSLEYNGYLQAVVDSFSDYMNISIVDFFELSMSFTTEPHLYGFENVETPCLSFGVTQNAFCKDRDGYLFWDALHITKKAHALIAATALRQLPDPD